MPEPSAGAMPTHVLALVRDLFFASRIREAARAAGVSAVTVARGEDLLARAREGRPRIILVDLDTPAATSPDLIARLKGDAATAATPVVAFVAHVNREAAIAARDAGADRVLARSAFVRELPALVRLPDASET